MGGRDLLVQELCSNVMSLRRFLEQRVVTCALFLGVAAVLAT